MELEPTPIPGCYLVRSRLLPDDRGSFLKLFHHPIFGEAGLSPDWREIYCSSSRRGVIRGMHFQSPPADHEKLVFCLSGEVLDVILDLRRGSPTERRHLAIPLRGEAGVGVYVAAGCAHGFLGISEQSSMLYLVTTPYAPDHDRGIAWDSFGFDWPVQDPILSARDAAHPRLSEFDSPFSYSRPE